MNATNPTIQLSKQVLRAVETSQPVVALESTIITHGMPYPENLETAKAVEQAVRENGAVPATIAVINGTVHAGLETDQIEGLALARDVMKLSRADLAFAVSQARTGSTTVASTMMIAQLAGLPVFATGGIGGVHRGAETSFDISADLEELARTEMIVICAGAKAILDLKKTYEVLETKGVTVIGYQCDDLPAFWSRHSGIPSPLRINSVQEIADLVAARRRLEIVGSVLIANPVPQEHEIAAQDINRFIDRALKQADEKGIIGKEVTPFLLSSMLELTQGQSLQTNIQLILSNAKLAARIAVEIKKHQLQQHV